MIVPKFTPFVLPILLISLFLSGCTLRDPAETGDQSLDSSITTGQDGLDSQSSENYSLSNSEAVLGESVKNDSTTPIPEKGTMPQSTIKQLADFPVIEGQVVTLHTSKGAITFELYREQAPITTANFLHLATTGFYDGVVFHRVIENFMAQVGDPLSKDPSKKALWGTSGPGYTIPDEFDPQLKHDAKGIVSMANTGQPSTGGSQFFITHEPTPWLDGKHTIFGRVTAGLDVLDSITVGDTINSVSIE